MATAEDDGYDSDGCRFSCEPTEERRALERARRAWSSADDGTRAFWTKTRATWSQTTQCVEIAVSMPVDTRAEDISVDIQTTRLVVRVRWHGEVRALTGPLRRRCRADESVWTLSSSARECELLISLAKDDAGADARADGVADRLEPLRRGRRDEVRRRIERAVEHSDSDRSELGHAVVVE